jgi:hypothetical protein
MWKGVCELISGLKNSPLRHSVTGGLPNVPRGRRVDGSYLMSGHTTTLRRGHGRARPRRVLTLPNPPLYCCHETRRCLRGAGTRADRQAR